MTNYDQCVLLYSWGIDLTPYVPVMITPDEYKQITGSDYVASKS
ncbi:XkdX family protein [Lacticaseibacillus paracasei]|nr:XkdX family protein [Lacticaseibacillus paracasei]